jgi:hypothetical protein
MEQVRDRTFTGGEMIETDGVHFSKCHFDGVHLCYCGGEHPAFEDCTFTSVGWFFDGAALRTIQLLQANGNGEGGRTFIEDLFRPGHYIGA